MGEFNQITFEAIKILLAGIVGGLIGARANDKFTRRREKESGVAERKRDFLAFMHQFKGEAVNTYPVVFGDFYRNKIPNLREAASRIMDDLPTAKRQNFVAAIATACELGNKQINELKAKDGKVAAIDEIIHIAGGNEF